MTALCVILFAFSISGCSRETSDELGQEKTLWVLTEKSTSDGMNMQLSLIADYFESLHGDAAIQIEIMPINAEEREIRLKQLQAQIMAGKGPDIYLLPTGNELMTDAGRITVDPLFQDAVQSMYNGVFADISKYYDGDDTLGKDALASQIMDAGMIGGARYVLPLRYNIPLVFTESSRWSEYGLNQEIFDSGVTAIAEAALDSGDAFLIGYIAPPTNLSLMSDLFDYEKGELLVTVQEIREYMRLYQQRIAAVYASEEYMASYWEYYWKYNNPAAGYIWFGTCWINEGLPACTGSLNTVMDHLAISCILGQDISVLPLRAADGSVNAEVTYYGAVGSSCEDPELAYELLRLFLAEEYQWGTYRPRIDKTKNVPNQRDPQKLGLVENSWPVRWMGSTTYLWENMQYQLYNVGDWEDLFRRKQFRDSELVITDEDVTVFTISIDEVRFPISQDAEDSLSYALSLLNDDQGNPTQVDIDSLAEEVWTTLWWHLAEG